MYGYFRQAFAIIDIANNFEVIPFIRSKAPFNYFVFMSKIIDFNLSKEQKNPRSVEIEFKSTLAYLLYMEYRPMPDFEKIREKSIDMNFSKKIYTESYTFYTENNILKLRELINRYLEELNV